MVKDFSQILSGRIVLVEERRQRVLDLISKQGFVALTDLAKTIQVSDSTIRRDLDYWADEGLVRRTHGGAIYVGDGAAMPALEDRSSAQLQEKRAVARAAVDRVRDGETVLLGGTNEQGSWDEEPKPFIAERIVAQCAAIDPRLRGATIVGHRVGLRPYRPEVRLESEPFGDGVLWHNYGHGGGGISLSWGCAGEVAAGILGGQ